jgi:hypothetical protein
MKPVEWGVAVEKDDKVYLHIIKPEKLNKELILNQFPYKVNKAYRFETGKTVESRVDKAASILSLRLSDLDPNAIDNVIVLQVSR